MDGIEALEAMSFLLYRVSKIPDRIAVYGLNEVLKVAHAQEAAGVAPDGSAWEPLREGGDVPLAALTSGVGGKAYGSSFIITTPVPLKYHQGGFAIHTGALGQRLREAKLEAVTARHNADKERLKRARKMIRTWRSAIRTEVEHVVARRTLPKRGAPLPAAWAEAIQRAVEGRLADVFGRAP